eukprot:tig00020956_g16519.t1
MFRDYHEVQLQRPFTVDDALGWTHYAVVYSVDPANPNNPRVSVVINGSLAEEYTIAGSAENPIPGPNTAPALTWFLESSSSKAPYNVRRDVRVWGRALSVSEINANRYFRIRGAAQQYDNFPDLKINADATESGVLTLGVGLAVGEDWSRVKTVPTPWTLQAAGHWTHYAFVFSTDPANPFTTHVAVVVNGTLVARFPTGVAPRQRDSITCPPSLTISRVKPVNVTIGGVVKRLCGAQMPDLRFLIAGNWSDWRVNITQHPKPGDFLPAHSEVAPTSPEWHAAGFGTPSPADGIRVSFSIENPTDVGPEGSCSFGLFVRDDGPPLCPDTCPPRVDTVPVDPATCSVTFPDLRQRLALPSPSAMECIPAFSAGAGDFVQESEAHTGSSDPSVQPNALWAIDGSSPFAKEVRIRHILFPQGPACPVRVLAYFPQTEVSWIPSVSGSPDALNSSAVAALGPNPNYGLWARQFHASIVGSCPQLLVQQCTPRVRVQMNPKLGLSGSDVDRAGNFTFAPGKRAHATWIEGGSVRGAFSREVPDAYLTDYPHIDIAPGEVLRTYSVSLQCALNKGVPAPAKYSFVTLEAFRVEIRKPAPGAN